MNNTRDNEQAAERRWAREVTLRATELVLDYVDDGAGSAQRATLEQLVASVACKDLPDTSGYLGADAAVVAARCLELIR